VELPSPSSRDPNWNAGLGYRRCLDFDQIAGGKGAGQDDAGLIADDRFVVGALADGVSQSFFGDLAASICRREVLQYLWDNRRTPPDAAEFGDFLRRLERSIESAVASYPIPDRIGGLLRDELEERRRSTGSQAVFGAFVLDRATQDGAVTAYQVGDVSLFAYAGPQTGCPIGWTPVSGQNRSGAVLSLDAEPDGRIRSTGVGNLLLAYGRLSGVRGIVVHSDGLPSRWGGTLDGIDNPEGLRERLRQWAARDDASFILALSTLSRPLVPVEDTGGETDPGNSEVPRRPAMNPNLAAYAGLAVVALALFMAWRVSHPGTRSARVIPRSRRRPAPHGSLSLPTVEVVRKAEHVFKVVARGPLQNLQPGLLRLPLGPPWKQMAVFQPQINSSKSWANIVFDPRGVYLKLSPMSLGPGTLKISLPYGEKIVLPYQVSADQ
jgi:hypothetical protein